TVQHLGAVERGLVGDAGDFRQALLHFLVDRGTVRGGVGAVGGLHGQVADRLQVGGDLIQRAAGGLRQVDRVRGVRAGLGQAADLGGVALRDREARGVVGGAVELE